MNLIFQVEYYLIHHKPDILRGITLNTDIKKLILAIIHSLSLNRMIGFLLTKMIAFWSKI